MTLIDGTRKKINFVKQSVREMGLSRIEALHARAEDLAMTKRNAGRFAVVVSRAVADLNVVATLAGPMLTDGGKLVVYKGPEEALPSTLKINADGKQGKMRTFQVASNDYVLPHFGDQRRAVLLTAL